MAWKNTIAVFQTFEAPPNKGKMSFVNIGWTENSSVADKKMVVVKMTAKLIERRVSGLETKYCSASLNVISSPARIAKDLFSSTG